MSSIQDRLKKLPPFDDDIPMLQDVKKIAEQQSGGLHQKKEVEEPQEAPIEEPVEEPKEEPVVENQEEIVETPEAQVEPEKTRTAQQFDKLKEHNQQLKEENKALLDNVLDSLKPKEQEFTPEVIQQVEKHTTELPQDKVDDVYANLIDKDGYIDPDLLIKTLRQANDVAVQAKNEAKEANRRAEQSEKESKKTIRDFEEDREVRLVHKKYPSIDPKNEGFNELFWDDVRKEIATSPILKGENLTFMQAADKIWNERYIKEVEVKKVDKEKLEEVEDQKRNINANIPVGRANDYYAKSDQEALRQASIIGRKGALAERLKRAGQ